MFRSRYRTSPDVALTPVDRLARAVAGHGHGSTLPLPTEPVSDEVFGGLLAVAGRDRLIGAVAELVVTGDLAVTEDQCRSLIEHHTDWARHALDVERLLLRVGDCFGGAGIDFRVLKGVALSRLVYDDPAWRVFGDLDLLVPAAQFDHAVRLARTDLGGEQPVPELRPGFDHEFGKEALVRVGLIELDLHRTFVAGPFGLTIDLDRLFESETPLDVGGRRFASLEPVALFLHACYNLALGDYPVRLCSLRDLVLVRDRLDLALETIVPVARSWRATAVVQRAAQLTLDMLKLDASHDFTGLARLTVSRRERWLLRSYLTTARSYSRPLASLVVVPGLRARARYARALLAPSEEYLRTRGWTERSHLKRARDRLLRRG